MMTAATPAAPAPRRRAPFSPLASVRRSSDIGLAFAMGGLVGLLIFVLPMQAALATAVVGAFVLIMLVDTRVALLALLLVRASIDYFASIPLLAVAGGVNTNALMSLLVIALGVTHIAMHRINIRRIPLGTPSALFVGISFITLAITPDVVAGFEDWLRILTSLIVYILVVDLMQTERERRWLLRVLVLAAVLPLCVGLWQFVNDSGDHSTPGYNRILATFVHPSPYGFFLVQIFPLALVLFFHAQSRIARLSLGVMLPLIMLSIYATQTRGAWIGILVMVAVFMWFRARWTLLFIPLFLAAVYIGVPSVRARVTEATTGTCESVTYCQSSVLWRTKQWEQVINVASPPELLTVGSGLHSIQSTVNELSHNEYLRLLVETGAVGLALTVVVYVSLFKYTAAGYRDAGTPYQRDLMLAFLMVLTSRVVMVGADNLLAITVIEWYFWAFAGVIVVESGAYDRFAHIQDDKRALRRLPAETAIAPMPKPEGTPA